MIGWLAGGGDWGFQVGDEFEHFQSLGSALYAGLGVAFAATEHVPEHGAANFWVFEEVAGFFYQVDSAHGAAEDVDLLADTGGQRIAKSQAEPFL